MINTSDGKGSLSLDQIKQSGPDRPISSQKASENTGLFLHSK